ncbi:AraC-type DNA-binding protein [Pedobacter steynii]|uniref:AraC-type DNA-binding protein n=1 Tax=Pedobacter steynii TaxID=430522 RepID=A0A1G9N3F7_9SPHI|nr:AraC family transcriptional regulator [Pedobacter steynii]NQX39426.1 helix-turn-helix transcriptional regulator [Pedobacter steynii]SDL80791.1 AraC-type DNA-binding protein [Pedobacter steynii]
MKEVIHQYGVELDWVAGLAAQLGGHVEGNRIIIPDEVHPGNRYILPINESLTAFIIDVNYRQDVVFKLRNTRSDFVGIYFNLTEGDSIHILDEVSRTAGRWGYNLAIFDADMQGDFQVKAECTTYMIAIFIKKTALKQYISNIPEYTQLVESIFNPKLNTIVRFDRMSNQAWWLMNELRKVSPEGPLYDVFVTGTVYGLIGDYMDQLISQEIIIEQVIAADVVNIMTSQAFLIENIENAFPGIAGLSSKAMMSETKYKKLFKKMTGVSPNAFFLSNKLSFAKEVLETGNYTIAEIADRFNFFGASHFIEQFKNAYGVPPKEYLTQL